MCLGWLHELQKVLKLQKEAGTAEVNLLFWNKKFTSFVSAPS